MRASKLSPASPSPLLPSRSFARAATRTNTGTDVQQREVAGAPAKVSDQNQLVMIQRRLVRISRRDWLHLKFDRLKTRMKKRLSQAARTAKSSSSALSAPTNRTGRPTVAWRTGCAKLPFCRQSQIGQDARDQILNGVAPPEDLCASQVAAGQVRLQRLNQPAFVLGMKIMLDRRWPREALNLSTARVLVLLQVEHRAKRFRVATRSREARPSSTVPSGSASAIELFVVPKSMPSGGADGVRSKA